MFCLGVILARAGSKGLRCKCMHPVAGRAMIDYTFDHALASSRIGAIVLSSDAAGALALARSRGIETIDRPAALATDGATIDAAVRHAVEVWESRHARRVDAAVILYGNVPVRAPGVIDRAIDRLTQTGATSIRTVAPVGKHHPDWLHRLEEGRMRQYRENSIYRRQDLEPIYYHDAAVIVVTRDALFAARPGDSQSFLGDDRFALVQRAGDAVDVDDAADVALAEALLAPRVAVRADASATTAAAALPSAAVDDPGRSMRPADARRCLIIAEAGVNHDGSPDAALRMVDAAVAAGADAVKFQVFRAAALTTASAPLAAYQRAAGAVDQRAMLARLELSDDALRRLAEHCTRAGIEFLATPFSPEDVARLVRLGVRAIKLASTDLNNVPLQRAAIDAGLPLIVSTGAAVLREIDDAVARLCAGGATDRLTLMHCVSAYPTPLESANLAAICAMRRRWSLPIGYSDHTRETATGALAVAAGACMVEKHFTLDRSAPGPDHAMALEPADLHEYVRRVREASAAHGEGSLGMSAIEADVRRVARRKLVFSRALGAGECITPEMLAAKRPGGGIEPDAIDLVVGRRLRVAVGADDPVAWDLLQ